MATNVRPSKYLASIGLLVMVLVIPTFISADCLKDRYGDIYCGAGRCLIDRNGIVWCSRYYDGDIKRTFDGRLLCGKGDCEKLTSGKVFCSTEVGGTILLNSKGHARCYGECELASEEMCENTIAGSSNN